MYFETLFSLVFASCLQPNFHLLKRQEISRSLIFKIDTRRGMSSFLIGLWKKKDISTILHLIKKVDMAAVGFEATTTWFVRIQALNHLSKLAKRLSFVVRSYLKLPWNHDAKNNIFSAIKIFYTECALGSQHPHSKTPSPSFLPSPP